MQGRPHRTGFTAAGLCAALIAMALTGGPARAMQPQGMVRGGASTVVTPPAARADGGARVAPSGPSLVAGQVEAVEPAQSRLRLHGRWVQWRPGQVRVLSGIDGSPRSAAALRAGQPVRLALDPSADPRAPVAVLIYLEAQP